MVPGAVRALAALARRKPEEWAHKHVHYFDETLKSREEARQYGEPLASPEGARAFARYMAETLSASAMSDFVRELERRRERGEPFPVPLMLVYARQDPMVPPKVGKRLAKLIPSAELVWLEDSSHFAHVDSPERFLDAALPFLSSPRS
jgi:pimeloyl-ACP methyl ester carboxylesterase